VPATAEPLSPAAGPGSPGLSEPPGSAGSPGSSNHHDRNVGIVCAAGGGAALVLGLALWASYASLQTSIDDHPTRTRSDFEDLRSLEDRAGTYAIAGDVLVVAGLAVGGLGAYYLLRHPQQRVVIAPSPIGHGAGLTLSIVGGL
jgi:hypothetical protein